MAESAKLGQAYVEITTKLNKFYAGLGKARAKFSTTINRMEMTANRFGSSISRVFRRVGMTMGVALVAGTRELGKFQMQMAEVSTMLDRKTMPLMKEYTESVKQMSMQFGESTATISKGLYQILSATIPAEKALNVLRVSTMSAIAGVSDTLKAADVITTILNSYNMEASQAIVVSDKLFESVRRGKITYGQLAHSLGRVISTAALAGVKLEEVLAAISTMTRMGLRPQESIFALNRAINGFLRPTDSARVAADKFGITLDSLILRERGLAGVFKELQGASAEAIAEIFPGIRSLKAVAALTGGYTGFLEDLNLQMGSAGATQRAYNKQIETLGYKMKQMWQSTIGAGRSLGQLFISVIGGKGTIDNLAESFRNLSERIETFIGSGFFLVIREQVQEFASIINESFQSIGKTILENKDVFIKTLENMTAAFKVFANTITPIINNVILPAFSMLAKLMATKLVGGFTAVFVVVSILVGALSKLWKIASLVFTVLKILWVKVLLPLIITLGAFASIITVLILAYFALLYEMNRYKKASKEATESTDEMNEAFKNYLKTLKDIQKTRIEKIALVEEVKKIQSGTSTQTKLQQKETIDKYLETRGTVITRKQLLAKGPKTNEDKFAQAKADEEDLKEQIALLEKMRKITYAMGQRQDHTTSDKQRLAVSAQLLKESLELARLKGQLEGIKKLENNLFIDIDKDKKLKEIKNDFNIVEALIKRIKKEGADLLAPELSKYEKAIKKAGEWRKAQLRALRSATSKMEGTDQEEAGAKLLVRGKSEIEISYEAKVAKVKKEHAKNERNIRLKYEQQLMSEHDKRMSQLEEEHQKIIDNTKDEALADKWLADQKRKLTLKETQKRLEEEKTKYSIFKQLDLNLTRLTVNELAARRKEARYNYQDQKQRINSVFKTNKERKDAISILDQVYAAKNKKIDDDELKRKKRLSGWMSVQQIWFNAMSGAFKQGTNSVTKFTGGIDQASRAMRKSQNKNQQVRGVGTISEFTGGIDEKSRRLGAGLAFGSSGIASGLGGGMAARFNKSNVAGFNKSNVARFNKSNVARFGPRSGLSRKQRREQRNIRRQQRRKMISEQRSTWLPAVGDEIQKIRKEHTDEYNPNPDVFRRGGTDLIPFLARGDKRGFLEEIAKSSPEMSKDEAKKAYVRLRKVRREAGKRDVGKRREGQLRPGGEERVSYRAYRSALRKNKKKLIAKHGEEGYENLKGAYEQGGLASLDDSTKTTAAVTSTATSPASILTNIEKLILETNRLLGGNP